MSKKYGIGFLILIIAFVVLLMLGFRMSYSHAEEKQEEQTRTQAEIEVCYYIMEKDGYVIIYEGDKNTVYEYTSIRTIDLPENIQKMLKKGIKVTSLGQVYGFLENYSS